MNDDELSQQIKQHATRYTASADLRAAVRTQITLQAAASDHSKSSTSVFARIAHSLREVAWRSALAGFAGGIVLTVGLAWWVPRLASQELLSAELVASHVRALKVGPLIEVASSDRHTVKPWFQGKLDYAPLVIDLQSDGFPLLGGRVEAVAGSPVAGLVYMSRKHIIHVFVWPADVEVASTRSQRSGFNMVHWSDASMQVWVVSDLDSAEIERFGQAWRKRAALR
jgi:anti-sigma factor RsiW